MHLVTNLLIGQAYVAISGILIHLTRKTGRPRSAPGRLVLPDPDRDVARRGAAL